MAKDFTQLKALLEDQEEFPTNFIHKFIGRNSAAFREAIADLESRYPKMIRQTERLSSNEGHLSLTYHFEAESADEIIEVLSETQKLKDVLIVL